MAISASRHGDQHDIEQARREGGDGEAAKRVQHAGIERDQRHAEEIGQRDARQQHGELELRRIGGKAWRQQQHEPGHDDLAGNREHDEQQRQPGKRLLGEGPRGNFAAVSVKALGEERNEGRIEGAFGEQAAKQVGHAEGDEEGVGHGSSAEHRGDQHVADEAEHAAPDGHGADGGESAIKCHPAQALTKEARKRRLEG